jgi:hypothetical protein
LFGGSVTLLGTAMLQTSKSSDEGVQRALGAPMEARFAITGIHSSETLHRWQVSEWMVSGAGTEARFRVGSRPSGALLFIEVVVSLERPSSDLLHDR